MSKAQRLERLSRLREDLGLDAVVLTTPGRSCADSSAAIVRLAGEVSGADVPSPSATCAHAWLESAMARHHAARAQIFRLGNLIKALREIITWVSSRYLGF